MHGLNHAAMRDFLNIAKALSDPARLRVLLALRGGELCLCHCIALLKLSPSTVSKHLELLYQAGLVERRKEGRWCFFRLAERDASPAVRGALRWVDAVLSGSADAQADAGCVCELRGADRTVLAACYQGARGCAAAPSPRQDQRLKEDGVQHAE